MHARLEYFDRRMGLWFHAYGHITHRIGLAMLFVWFGLLKSFGYETTSSLLAHTVYWSSPDLVVPILGWWEVAIGLCLLIRRLNRVALALLVVRLPGTILAFFMLPDVCFQGSVWVPTPEGQYLVKDLVLFGAAMIIGGTIRGEVAPRVHH